MTRVSTTRAREALSDVIYRVIYQGERIVLERHGKDVVALVPVRDLELLEQIEDRMDLEEARERLMETGRVPWKQVKERLGLEKGVQGRVPSERSRRTAKASSR
jgi:prevent-host-death family protein